MQYKYMKNSYICCLTFGKIRINISLKTKYSKSEGEKRMQITKNLKLYMLSKGIRLAHVAHCCDIPRDRLYKVMNGAREIKAEELLRICRHLKITVEQLDSGEGLFD